MSTQLDRDARLLEALRQHEATAAERLLTTYGNRANRLATRITGNKQDAEEVVQDAFWAVLREIDRFRGDCAFGSWLFRIVANAAYQKLRYRRKRRRDVPWDKASPVFDQPSRYVMSTADCSARVNDPASLEELRLALATAINELPASYRTVLVLHDVVGFSHLDIVGLLGLSVPAVKTRIHRARLCLRKQLSDAVATLDASTTPKDKSRGRGQSWNAPCWASCAGQGTVSSTWMV